MFLDCGQSDVFQAPVGTPIEVTGDFATLNVSAGVTGNRHPGTAEVVPPLEPGTIITLAYEVTWDDGSEASFWLLLTVQDIGAHRGRAGHRRVDLRPRRALHGSADHHDDVRR